MKKNWIPILLVFGSWCSCQPNTPTTQQQEMALPHREALPQRELTETETERLVQATGATIPALSFQEFEKLMNQKNDDVLYIYDFWATWCSPCVAEIPHFDRLQKEFPKKVKVVLVNLDNPKLLEKEVIPFVRKKQIESEVVHIKNLGNDEIEKISPEWSGAIPATLFVQPRKKVKLFHEGEISFEELKAKIQPLIL